jgi:hypothetical protein
MWGLLCGIVQPSYETLAWNMATKLTHNNHKYERLFVEKKKGKIIKFDKVIYILKI